MVPLEQRQQQLQQMLQQSSSRSTPTGYGALAKIISSSVLNSRQKKLALEQHQMEQQQAEQQKVKHAELAQIYSGYGSAPDRTAYANDAFQNYGGDPNDLANALSSASKIYPDQFAPN